MWQSEWPSDEGAWWFYGRLPDETRKTLVVAIVRKTADEPPVYFAYWTNHFWCEGEIEGRWLRIETPALPED